jgi:heme-degrading monooxygenase HmoA
MPVLPWKEFTKADDDAEYLVMASFLPLARFGATVRFFRFVRAVRRQLATAEGLVGYSLWAKPIAKRYWTLSVWRDEAALMTFMRTQPHSSVMARLRADMDPTKFVRWTVKGAETRVSWDEALRHLDSTP